MDHQHAVVLIPGPGSASETLASLSDEIARGVPIVSFDLKDTDAPGGGFDRSADEILSTAETLAFVRTGDRFREGALAARLTPFVARPGGVLSVAGYRLVDSHGGEIRTAPPPLPPFPAHSLLLRPAAEASAVLVRADALDRTALDLIVRPHGDAVVWGRLAARFGLVPSAEIAADVKLDPTRHGHAPAVRLAALLEFARAGELSTSAPDGVVLRRELLRRLYIEPEPANRPPLDLSETFGGAEALVLADLQWALERQREALAAERVTWPQGVVAPEDEIPEPTDLDVLDARMLVDELHHHVMVRDTELMRLSALLEQRDSLISRLHEFGPEVV